jgi:hypothetical protein
VEYIARKYPRTLHLPQSLSVTSDDKIHKSLNQFKGLEVIITEKMDGENTTIFNGGTHARSIDGRYHSSRAWMKQFSSTISPFLDACERICGEYLYARHSIAYDDLETYFYGFGWFIDGDLQSWDDMVQRFEEFNIKHVPVLYSGLFYDGLIEETISKLDLNKQEGFVLRNASLITENEFSTMVGKFVRKNHVQTEKHWMHSEIVKNNIIKN